MRRFLPTSLAGRTALVLFAGLVVAHGLAFWLMLVVQGQTRLGMMLDYLPRDIATSVAILERIPPAERPAWLPRLARRNYGYELGVGASGTPVASARTRAVVDAVAAALGPGYRVDARVPAGSSEGAGFALGLALHDGTPLAIVLAPPPVGVSPWIVLILAGQLVAIAGLTWWAVRVVTRPLADLAAAADGLGADLTGPPLATTGTREVDHAVRAFNAMQGRIGEHLAERVQMLAAISHDLQTPMARLALRADLLDDTALRDKLHQDLRLMQHLVDQGIAYARSVHASTEPPCRIDLHALLDSLVCDYADAGQRVSLESRWSAPVVTRPETLRRIVTNLVDNALKFGDDVRLAVEAGPSGGFTIVVRDRGPGIPEPELAAVLRPFHRVDGSRSRDTGGSGLGLAIADQLTRALGGTLLLRNRSAGGLSARVSLPG
jgi:signal transduction histidine kinase